MKTIAIALTAALFLTACQSNEEKAESYYKSGLSLMEKGDDDRALIEFRNVFKVDGLHKEARRAYADIQLKRGILGEAQGQYLRLSEQYPEDGPARRTLTQMFVVNGNWTEAERHGREAIRLLPDDPTVKAIKLLLDYRKAVLDNDSAAKAQSVEAGRAYLQTPESRDAPLQPGLQNGPQLVRHMLIADALERHDPRDALTMISDSLESNPDDYRMNGLKLVALNEIGDMPAIGQQLREMVDRFPDNTDVQKNLIGWYMAQKDFNGAESFLRERAGDPTSAPDGHLAVVQLLRVSEGVEAARAELEALLAANAGTENGNVYGALLAGIDYEEGNVSEALQRIEAILAKAEPSEQTNRIRVTQAKMLAGQGDQVGARAQVETVLKADPSNVEALKLRGSWLIGDDKPGEAITDLRRALDFAPRDSEIMTLMAQAHERDGAKDLAGERLAMAVEVSSRGAAESVRYASFLQSEGRTPAAIAVLNDSRTVHPQDLQLLQALAQLYLATSNWTGAEGIATTLAALPQTPQTVGAADRLRAAILMGQGQLDAGMKLLSELANEAGRSGDVGAERSAAIALLQTQVRSGRVVEARQALDQMMADTPNDVGLRMMSASLYAATGEVERAEGIYRSLIDANPQNIQATTLLIAQLRRLGRIDDSKAVLEAGLKADPDATALLQIKAGDLEREQDIDGAITVYERLYAQDSNNPILANNLASLISTYRDSPEEIEHASAVARRLRGTTVPAFADTYGWIAYRRGDHAEALPYLETAAKGLAQDPVVQIHLGMAYAALGRVDEAKTALQRGLDLAGQANQSQPIQQARAKLEELKG